ncbi:septum formation inhibitor Maf [Shewanella avicenniae]|uniref:dTTP/UTP pyrophosphatase n=1 Tax=Shewanella avicenniae TaxID=2814294 RepID=A0ABX7QRB3_9GAMM|nr:Maf family protein [Shewanella avicenniae]QSX33231.1 septum formation inhibitor Maf [Shewanella avicenniae]
MKLVLASASPRRRELLAQLGLGVAGFSFDVLATDIDESAREGELAADFVTRLALQKAQAGLALVADNSAAVLGSDTIVVVGERVLGKPQTAQDAFTMLRSLSGATHRVMTAVALVSATQMLQTLVTTDVTFTEMTDAQIHAYIATGEPMDKAGAYGIQGLGGSFVSRIDGSYSAVVGLPLVETRSLLQQMQLV